MPWFDDYSSHNTFCKVYNDGGCYVAMPSYKGLRRKQSYRPIVTAIEYTFRELHLEALKAALSGEALFSYIVNGLKAQFPEKLNIEGFVTEQLLKVQKNLFSRKKRFRRKAYLNRWNYFVTITYDDENHDEEGFRKSLRKCLSNLHSRRNWLYMGVFERAPETGRLHFHALMYIPEGEMVEDIYERRDYSTRKHKMQITHSNRFFERRFGRNDFEALSEPELRHGKTINYLLKYLEKTAERIIYSRGIPTEFYKMINDDDVVCEMLDFITKYILYDDVVDYDVDVMHRTRQNKVFYVEPLPS